MKKRSTIIILAIILILPTIAAIVSYNMTKNSSVSSMSISKIVIEGLDGKTTYTAEKSDAKLEVDDITTNLVQFFVLLNDNSQESKLPEQLDGTKYFKVTYTSYGRDVVYKYYFNTDPSLCYYLDDQGTGFKINEDYATLFINSVPGMTLFDTATLPYAYLGNDINQIVHYSSLEWHYDVGDGTMRDFGPKTDSVANDTFIISGSLTLSFSIEPDVIDLVVKEASTGEEKFNGNYTSESNIEFEIGHKYTIDANVTWSENTDKGYNGKGVYNFTVNCADKPVFSLSSATCEVGDFVVLSVMNVQSKDSITATFDQENFKYNPIFLQDGDVYRALIPFSLATEAGEYTLKASADGAAEELFTIKVTERNTRNASRVENTAKLTKELEEVYSTRTDKVYFDGIFGDAVTVYKTAKYGFSANIKDEDGEQSAHTGYDYYAENGEDVVTANNGVVVYTGEVEGCGKVVVVDHGLGLMSTYALLDTVTCKVGDEVKTGDKLGTAGYDDYVHFGVSVFNVPVDVDPLWKDGVVLDAQ